jgi:hypothetical protein
MTQSDSSQIWFNAYHGTLRILMRVWNIMSSVTTTSQTLCILVIIGYVRNMVRDLLTVTFYGRIFLGWPSSPQMHSIS